MEVDFRYLGKSAKHKIFDAWLRCGSYCDRISVTTKSSRNPKNINLPDRDRIPTCDSGP